MSLKFATAAVRHDAGLHQKERESGEWQIARFGGR